MTIAKSAGAVRSGLVAAAALIAAVTTHSSLSHAAVVNGGFEAPLVSSFPSNFPYLVPPNYVYIPNGGPPATADSWLYDSGAGLINGSNPGAFGGEPSFVGNQYAFIQSAGSSISQVFSATPGIGQIDWLQAGRPDQGSAQGNQTLEIYLNGILVDTIASITGQDFIAKSISGVTLLSSNTLLFLGTASGDNTAFIDEVSVTTTAATPLPAAAWLLGSVLAGGAGFGRWRKRKAKGAALVPAAA